MLKRLWNSGLRPLLIIIGVFLVLLLAAYGWARHTVGRELDAAMQAARDAGIALTPEALEAQWDDGGPYYHGPPERSPRKQIWDYEFPVSVPRSMPRNPTKVVAAYESADPQTQVQMRQIVDAARPDFAWLDELAAAPPDHPRAYVDIESAPPIRDMWLLGWAGILDAHFAVQEGRIENATQRAVTLIKFAHRLESSPPYLHWPARHIQHGTADLVAHLPDEATLPKAPARTLIEQLHHAAAQRRFIRVSEWEVVRTMEFKDRPVSLPQRSSAEAWFSWALGKTPVHGLLAARAAANSVNLLVYFIQGARKPYHEGHDELLGFDQAVTLNPIPFLIPADVPADFHRRNFYAKVDQYRRLTDAQFACREAALGLALRLYRQDHHEPPAELAALVPEYIESIPTNPFTGKPIQKIF